MPPLCAKCGATPLSTLTEAPLCEPCRIELVRRPFPEWVKVSSILVLMAAAFSIVQVPKRWANAVHLKQARNQLSAHKWPEAYKLFHPFKAEAMKVEDVDLSLEYVEAAMMTDHLDEALGVMTRLKGHHATNDQISRADYIGRALANKLHSSNASVPGSSLPPR